MYLFIFYHFKHCSKRSLVFNKPVSLCCLCSSNQNSLGSFYKAHIISQYLYVPQPSLQDPDPFIRLKIETSQYLMYMKSLTAFSSFLLCGSK